MLNSKSLIKLSAGLLLLSAVAAPKAHAQSVDVPFNGTVPSTCIFNAPIAGTLAKSNTLAAMEGTGGLGGFATTVGTTGKLSVTCTSGGTLTAAAPALISAPATFTPAVRQSIVQIGTGTGPANFTSSPGTQFDNFGWAKSTVALVIPASAVASDLTVAMVVGANTAGTVPSGTYGYNVRLTVVGN